MAESKDRNDREGTVITMADEIERRLEMEPSETQPHLLHNHVTSECQVMEDETTPHHNDDLNGDDTGMGTLANRDDTGMGTLANRDDTGMGTIANRDDTGMGTMANRDDTGMGTLANRDDTGMGTIANRDDTGMGTIANRDDTGMGTLANRDDTGMGTLANRDDTGMGTLANRDDTGMGTLANRDDTGMGTTANRDDTGMGTLANRDDTGMGTMANRDDTGMGTTANGDNGSMATIVSSTVNQPSSLRKDPIKTNKILSIFKRRGSGNGLGNKPAVTMVASQSTTGLIFEGRPKGLPAKTPSEEKKHQKLYQDMLSSVKKKEMKQAEASIKLQQKRQSKEDLIANDQRKWSEILPKFESLRQSKEVKDIWWHGLPPGVRGEVWKKALGNDLNISPELYKICLKRCTERLELAEQRVRSDSVASITSISRENSVEVIHLDVLRTFPTLGFFQKGGPYHNTLHDILGAYACYRPDVGYVQGMSFIAAVLLLNMDTSDAFIALSNLLNRSSYLAFFRVDQDLMKPYFNVFSSLLEQSLPKISTHFTQLSFYPQFYLMEWIFTIYTRVLPLDIACRVWDLFCRDGDVFLYRTALGILNLYQSNILELTTIADVGQFLGHLPSDLDSDSLFNSIANIALSDKKFNSMLLQYKRL